MRLFTSVAASTALPGSIPAIADDDRIPSDVLPLARNGTTVVDPSGLWPLRRMPERRGCFSVGGKKIVRSDTPLASMRACAG
jgi:hypothetical protein